MGDVVIIPAVALFLMFLVGCLAVLLNILCWAGSLVRLVLRVFCFLRVLSFP